MQTAGSFKVEAELDTGDGHSVVFYSPIAGGAYIAVGLEPAQASALAADLNRALLDSQARCARDAELPTL